MSEKARYLDEALSFEERARDLVSRMSLEEKISQTVYRAVAIERLGVQEYNWWNEALHGVARAGVATVFPQAIGLAAAFDEELIYHVAEIIASEARAKYNAAQRNGDYDIYKGLTFWSPNVNIFRDPRWGRGHETYGEDPYLSSRLGVAFVKGLQGDGKYMKAAACAKHFAVHSGPESGRHAFDAVVSKKDLYETYLPAFKACVTEGQVEAVMGAYNRTNGEPCCGSKTLLNDILRDEWGFKGHVVSDCGAVQDFHEYHYVTATAPESAALAINNGCDLNCGQMFYHLQTAYNEGLITEETVEKSAIRLMTTRMKLGMFDGDRVAYNQIPFTEVDSPENKAFSLEAARRTLVLLKNRNNTLPLKKDIKSIAVIGPNADNRVALEGNYCGTASEYVTVVEGIREKLSSDARLFYAQGCHLYRDETEKFLARKGDRLAEAMEAARAADVSVVCLGLDATLEGEDGDANNSYASGDKRDLSLPGMQNELLKRICGLGKPVIVVAMTGSAIDLCYADENADAVIQAWYPGAQGGRAVADLLFGEYSPSGRLPVTFYRTIEELPDFTDYSMDNRTYRYMKNEALYPFGYGLSYASFTYDGLMVERAGQGDWDYTASVNVRNAGDMDGREIVQLYIKDVEASVKTSHWTLRGIKTVEIPAGGTSKVEFSITFEDLAVFNEDGKQIAEPGDFIIYIGGSQPDARSVALTGHEVLQAGITA